MGETPCFEGLKNMRLVKDSAKGDYLSPMEV